MRSWLLARAFNPRERSSFANQVDARLDFITGRWDRLDERPVTGALRKDARAMLDLGAQMLVYAEVPHAKSACACACGSSSIVNESKSSTRGPTRTM
jgi:hypothetical protein